MVCLPQTLNPFLEVLWRKLLMKSEGVVEWRNDYCVQNDHCTLFKLVKWKNDHSVQICKIKHCCHFLPRMFLYQTLGGALCWASLVYIL